MRLLITNDDGIFAPGIQALAKAAISRGHHVIICAPSTQCSANSQHITLDRPLLVNQVSWEGAQAYAMDGTPSDCARIGKQLADGPIDVCISGINKGANVGAGIYYSGTVSAARDAAMLYIPAIAVSLQYGGTEKGLQKIAEYAILMAEKCKDLSFPRCGVLNINGPRQETDRWKEPVFCPISSAYFLDQYVKRKSPFGQTYFWLGTEDGDADVVHMEEHAPFTDAYMLERGHITLTMISEFNTNNDAFTSLLTH